VKHAAIVFSSVALILVLLCSAWIRADADSRMRGEFAEMLTQEYGEDVVFYASGMFGKRLTIVPEYADHEPGGQVDCDQVIFPLILDKETMSEFHRKGFTSIQCGVREISYAKN
jgi:hypothetical protein